MGAPPPPVTLVANAPTSSTRSAGAAALTGTGDDDPLLSDSYTSPSHCFARFVTGRWSLPHEICYRAEPYGGKDGQDNRFACA